jgi:hypothetical protein
MLIIDLDFFESLRDLPPKDRMLRAALWYAKQGFKIIPSPEGTKNLGVPEQQATDDPKVIKELYTKHFIAGNIQLLLHEQDMCVMDADRHGDIDGFKNAGLVEADFDGLVVTTPHNGLHLYFKGKASFKRLPKGIEFKTTRVVVPPSVIDGVAYEWRTGGSPQILPPALTAKLKGLKIVSTNDKPLSASVSPEDYAPTPIAPLGYVKRLLEHMDPGADYDEWSKVGMAMHHNDDSDLSMETWRDWSMNSAKFKAGECEKKWASFSQFHGKPITLRWLIRTAKDNGCPDSPEDTIYYGANLAIDIEIEKINKIYIYRIMATGGRICWLLEKSEGEMEFCQWAVTDWKNMMQNQKIFDGNKWICMADVWLNHPERRTGEVNMWEPGTEPPNTFNLYRGLAVEPVPCRESEIQLFLDFTLDIICRGNKEYHRYLLDLLAFKVQHPLELSGICLVLQGGEGTGKGSLCRIMETIVGKYHSRTVSERRSLVGEYNGGHIASALWITANEAVWAGHPGEAERLKALITEPSLEWNEKHVPMWRQRNCILLAITTNNKWAVPADVDSRRFFVLCVADDKAKDAAYWVEFHKLLGSDHNLRPKTPEYMGKVLYFLQQRKITSSFTSALETVWLAKQRGQTILESDEDAFVSWVRLFLQETANDVYIGQSGECNFMVVQHQGKNWIIASDFYKDYRIYVRRNFHRRKPYTPQQLKDALEALGIYIKRVKIESLTLGQSKYPGPAENKLRIATSLPANELEKALADKYKLLTDDTADAED